ncbi:hypothetical protein U9M48_002379 [Paspalum notatum var. saurae]|uniref:Phytosulfokine n=1 Tax=Paspalum notatum var. saurae TaxID=547442 RepID=A0AAQ3PQT0_PASNO
MAPSPPPPRRAAVLLLLLSLIVLAAVARSSSATSRSHAELHDRHREVADEDTVTAADERCGGAGAEGEDEECLMRRTLAAHTDYIYTQGGGHN